MIQAGINGFGTIGKRVADAVRDQPDMSVAGIGKASPNHTASAADRRGYDVYSPVEGAESDFTDAGIELAGGVEDLVEKSDIIVDATPAGMGAEYRDIYEEYDTPAIFQGGEDADVAEVSFTARANYNDAANADYVRIVSCNTTGLNRLFAPLHETYGIDRANVTLVRCRGDISDVTPDPPTSPSKHAPDVEMVVPGFDVHTKAMKVPTTRHHMHSIDVTLDEEPDADEVRDLLDGQSRIELLDEHLQVGSTGALREYAFDRDRLRGDLWENRIWDESIVMDGPIFHCFQTIHRESDVVPENIDAIRAMTGSADATESIELTNETLGVGDV